jgi:hypothetical protein
VTVHFDADDLRRLRAAYQVLGLPLTSTASEIKREFRRLAKTWHPDKWPAGSPPQAKAADRMREINVAYEAIRHAPLRYHIEGHPRVAARAAARGKEVRHETVPITDRTEWAIRFVFGALLGLFMCGVLTFTAGTLPTVVWVVVPLLTGLASARYGNAFWSTLIESSWWLVEILFWW